MNKEKILKNFGYTKDFLYYSNEEIAVVHLSPELESDRLIWRVINRRQDIVAEVVKVIDGVETTLCQLFVDDSNNRLFLNGQLSKDKMSLSEITNTWRSSLALDGTDSMEFGL